MANLRVEGFPLKTNFFCTLALMGLSSALFAAPAVTIAGFNPGNNTGLFSLVVGATTVNFDDPTPAGISYSNLVPGSIRNTSQSGVCAQPPNDNTNYLCVGPGTSTPVTITFASAINYFGFYAGSLDTYNLIEFFVGDTEVFQLTGGDIATLTGFPATGNQSQGFYVNILAEAGNDFNKIVLSSTRNAFETDNHAFALATTIPGNEVPEPSTYALIGGSLLTLNLLRRRK